MAADLPMLIPIAPRVPDAQDCVRCGLCLESCPTYTELRLEADSPRGRIAIMRALSEGRAAVEPAALHHLDLCLDCRACETACPSGVQYGALLEQTRARLHHERPPGGFRQRLIGYFLRRIVTDSTRLRRWMRSYAWLDAIGLAEHLRSSGLSERLGMPLPPPGVVVPRVAPLQLHYPRQIGDTAQGTLPRRVLLLPGCATEAMTPMTNRAAIHLMIRRGFDVDTPPAQSCCGALHLHLGDEEEAKRLARRNVAALPEGDFPVVTCAAGCGAMLKQYGSLLRADPEWRERAARFSRRVRDIHELLVSAGTPSSSPSPKQTAAAPIGMTATPGGRPLRVVYHDACHLCHAQNIRRPPRDLIQSQLGVTLIPLEESEMCCGAAGSYAVTQPEMSARLARRKWRHLLAAAPDVVTAANVGCILQLLQYAPPEAAGIRVVHPVELLDQALSGR